MTDNYDGDPRIVIDENGASIEYADGQPSMDAGLGNNDIIGLFTAPGWPGNILLESDQQIGSDFEEQATGSITLEKLADIEDAARRAVQADVADTDNVSIEIANPIGTRLDIAIRRSPPGSDVNELLVSRYGLNWINQANTST